MKKLLASMAFLVSAFSANANASQTFSISNCTPQLVVSSPNNMNTTNCATRISFNNSTCSPCDPQTATLTVSPKVTTCAAPVVLAYNSCEKQSVAVASSCGPCSA